MDRPFLLIGPHLRAFFFLLGYSMQQLDLIDADWFSPLRKIMSLGSQDSGVAHQGELHIARQRHLGQFFTPDAIAAFMWQFVGNFMPNRKVSILDNSVGSGRLLQFANPDRHMLYGVDVHGDAIAAVQGVIEAAGFDCDFRRTGMEHIHPQSFDIAVINPPFSIHLESPNLKPLPGTTWGRYGPNTSALSHEYALQQALDASQVVVAPATASAVVKGNSATTTCDASRACCNAYS
jgi:hypothetical protein